MRGLLRSLAVIALTLVLAACQVDAFVEVAVTDDGSGVVTVAVALDNEAVERAGDLDRIIVTDDLETAGWTVEAPTRESDGLTWIRASKPFAEPDQLARLLAQVSPVFQVGLARDHSFGRTTFDIEGTIDLSDGLGSLGDEQLAELFGSPAGFDLEELEAEIGPLADATQLQFVVRLPYDVAGNGEASDQGEVWTLQLGDDPTDVAASASRRHAWTMVWVVVAGLFVLALLGLMGRRAWRSFTGAELVATSPRSRPAPAGSVADDDGEAAVRRLELIVLDGFGVLFDAGDHITSVLAPFVAERGGSTDSVEVAERYRQTSLGRLSTAELWAVLGVEGDAEMLDRSFVESLPLTDGALTFLERSKLQGLTLACLANGVATWFDLLRRRDSLDVYIATWLVSSDLGVRKPDPAAYEALSHATGVPLGNCLMIDDRTEHLDAARRAGMSTALFGSAAGDTADHPHLERFAAMVS